MQHRLDVLQKKNLNPGIKLRNKWISYELISPNLKRAIIAAEDAKFLKHKGFDFKGEGKAKGEDILYFVVLDYISMKHL